MITKYISNHKNGGFQNSCIKFTFMGTTVFNTVEPASDSNNTINYPNFFSSIAKGSKFVYNGATSTRYVSEKASGQPAAW